MNKHLGDFFHILATVGPSILALYPPLAPVASLVVLAITEAQKLKNKDGEPVPGPEKKIHAMNIVGPVVTAGHDAHIKGFEQPDVILATVSTGIDTVVGMVKVAEGTKHVVDAHPGPPA